VILHDATKTINNSELKNNKNLFVLKKQNTGELFFFKKKTGFSQSWLSFNPFCNFPLIAQFGTSHYQFDGVRAAHLEYRFLVLKKLRITGI